MHAIFSVPSCYKDCAEMLSSQHAKEKADNKHMLKLLKNDLLYSICNIIMMVMI